MKLDVNALKSRAKDLFAGFTPGQRTVLGIAVLAVVLGGYLFTKWASEPTYAALYSNLDPADASEITEELSARGVPYQLGANGTSVMVPQDSVYQLRLDMSSKGLPSGGSVGYSLLDKQGITTSEFRQRVDYQRALEGELSKTITAIEPVDAATVHLVIPSEDLFAEDEQKPSASVLVSTGSDATLTPGQVQAVVHLVSSSVEGLSPDDVTVADTTGRVLSVPGEDGMIAAAGDARSQQTAAFEGNLADSIQQMLTPVVGTGRAVVRVKASLDFDRVETTTERFENPAAGPLTLAESTSEERFTGTSTDGGAAGALATEATPIEEGDQNDYQKTEAERQFAVGKVTEEVLAAPGGVERLSVAVLLDDKVVSAGDMEEVQKLVTAAAGLDPNRGDSVEISRMTFDTSAADAAKKELETGEAGDPLGMARNVGAVLIVLVVLALAYRSARQSAKLRYPIAVPIDLPRAELAAESLTDAALPASDAVPLPATAESRPMVETHVGTLIDRQPEEVANLLRSWLADRRS